MPRRTSSHIRADKAIVRLHQEFLSRGWTVENISKDYGEDLLVRIFNGETKTPYSFYVQAKSTANIDRYREAGGRFLRYPLDREHLSEWDEFWEPVIIALWDSRDDSIYWEIVQTAERSPKYRKAATFYIPTDNLLDASGLKRLQHRIQVRHERLATEELGAQILIEHMQKALNCTIDYNPEAGILFIGNADGSTTIEFFGRFATRMRKIAERSGLSPEVVVERSMFALLDISNMYSSGGSLVIMDKNGGKTDYATLDDLTRYASRAAELR